MVFADQSNKSKNIESIYPLSPMQEGMLFHTLEEPESGVYFEQFSFTIHGNLDVSAFELAWCQVVKRHPALRTLFVWKNHKKLLQVVRKSVNLPWTNLDWRELSPVEQEHQLEVLLQADRNKGFELDKAPLMRIALIQLAAKTYKFVWSNHHLLTDGWCLPIIYKEVFAFYEANKKGFDLHLSATRPYSDYIAWLQQQDQSKAEAYWREALEGFTAPTPLVVDRTIESNSEQKKTHLKHELHLSAITTATLKSLAQKHHLTVSTFVQGAWALLLSRYSGEQDVVFGATSSGRPPTLSGVESMVGLFINTLPVRVQVESETELLPWLMQLQRKQVEREQYSYSSLSLIQRLSEVPPGSSLFESIVVFQNYPVGDSLLPPSDGLQISNLQNIKSIYNYPLTLVVRPDRELLMKIIYSYDRFNADTIVRMGGHLLTLLEGMVATELQKLKDLPLLTSAESHQLLVEWNNTTKVYPFNKCIHQLFEEQVERSPDKVAVVFEDKQLTYRELNQRANCLAHHLKTLGVEPEVLVGICVERSIEMVVSLLGILKAGGAYLPLDPTLPKESLAFRLIDAQVPILLTHHGLLKREETQVQTVLYLDADWELIAQESEANPKGEVLPENLAYVLYTSGSTGQPKGVAIEHQQILNYLHAILDKLQLPTGASFANVSTFAADLGNTVIFPALCTGGCLHIVSQERVTDPRALAEYFVRHPIDCLKIVPTHLASLLTSKASSSIIPRQCLVLGGEAASWDLIEKIQQEAPNCRILNHYGPTETTVGVLTYPVSSKLASYNSKTVPIGRPIANTQVYILGHHQQPVPIGVPGELHIGGASLARGYLNRPDLTAEKFINPFNDKINTRLYKTGDLVRYLSDGNIEFLGRLDRQVKIRGFRIELSEVETTLASHPAVRETVVMAREDIPGHKYLAAYIVSNQKEALTSSTLRDFLKEKLPSYMVPGAFVMLNALPLTPNGKVDHQALPTPDTASQELETTFVAPRTRQEELLAQIWREVLHLQQVSIHDNFFELGGDSILSILIIAKAKKAGLQLTPKQIFQHQTIAELAAKGSTTGTRKAEQGSVTGSLPLTPIQHWFFAKNLPEVHHYNQAFLLLVPPTFDSTLLQQALQQLLVHHDALRLRFTKSEACWQQFNTLPDEAVPFSLVDLSTLPPNQQTEAIQATSAQLQASLNLDSGPLVRVALFNLGNYKPSRLLLVIHHLAVDGVSWRILLEDLQTAYQQLESGCSIQLPAKTTSFKDWAFKLTEYAHSSIARKELTYWQSISRTQRTRLPLDCSEGANTAASARTVSVSLNVEETRALLQEVPKAYGTQINDVLLTALVQVLAAWSGSNSVLVELEGHGREDILSDVDLSRTVGWFTTRFPVLLQHKATDNLGDSIKSIKEQLGAVPNRGIGYGLLRYLSGDASITSILQALPMAEVSFNYLGQFDWGMQADSLFKLAPESVGPEGSLLRHRSHLLAINGIVVEGQLQLGWTYSENLHHFTTIENLAQDYACALRSLIAHCLSSSARSYTPDVFENPTIQSFAQHNNSRQHEEDNATVPLHLLELPEDISELLPDDIEAAYPLAKMQEFMLHHYNNDHQKMGVYHGQKSYDIYDESLDLNAFKKALEILVQKHPAFRTVFITSNGTPVVQVVKKSWSFAINEQDISHIKSDEQENYLDVIMKQDRQNLFNIENPNEPLFRFGIFRKAKNRFEFLMSVHHAIADGWGSSEFLNQLCELYSVIKKREKITVVPDANVYKEFVALEKEIISSQDAADFWRLQLKNYVYKPLRPRQASVNEGEAVTCEQILNSEILQDLPKLCKELKVSIKAIFLSTYLDLIGTLMKEKTLCVGIVSNGRTERLSDPFGALGLFWNMVPFCQSISSDKGVQIKNVQQSLIDMESYVRYPLLEILADQQKTELFFATFNFVNFHNAKNLKANTDLKVNGRRFHDKFNFPLNYGVSMSQVEGNVSLSVEYDNTYFSRQEIHSMLQNYLEMLEKRIQESEYIRQNQLDGDLNLSQL
jgi:amino acid adenylation domain-containing protein/non-ribosomal peptide synthase protein (TIGR01720 family)